MFLYDVTAHCTLYNVQCTMYIPDSGSKMRVPGPRRPLWVPRYNRPSGAETEIDW